LSGSDVVTGRADGSVRKGSRVLGSLSASIAAVAASPGVIVAATSGGAVRIWAADHSLGFRERAGVDGLAVSPDGTVFATAGLDGVARIREVATGRLDHELRGHTKAVTGVAFNNDASLLATSSADFDVRVWDVPSGADGPVLKPAFGRVSAVAFSPDGRWLVSANPISAALFHMPAGTFVGYLYGPSGTVVGVGFEPNNRVIRAASLDGTLRGYDCLICGTLPDLLRLADERIAANR
jgi:hypothetical protein